MYERNLLFVDIETTGLDPTRHEIIEIGAILAVPQPTLLGPATLTFAKEWERKIIPERIESGDPRALEVSGYHRRDWSEAVPLQKAMEELTALAQNAVIVAQNVTFDWSFLIVAAGATRVPLDRAVFYHKVDLPSYVMGKYAGKLDGPQKYTLRELCAYYGVKNDDAHTALSDARATAEIYKRASDQH